MDLPMNNKSRWRLSRWSTPWQWKAACQ